MSTINLGRGQSSLRHLLLVVVAAGLLSCLGGAAQAASVIVGNINIEVYRTEDPIGLNGAVLDMNWKENAAFANQNCVKLQDIRWIQRVTIGKKIPGFTTADNQSLIDPRQGQTVPGVGVGDDLPWYDVTHSDLARTILKQDGSGRYYTDSPGVPQLDGQVITFETLVVAITKPQVGMAQGEFAFLGGVSWGFSLKKIGTSYVTILKPLVELADGALLRAKFNATLTNDFPKWKMVEAATAFNCPGGTPVFRFFVPEPATVVLSTIGLLIVGGIGWSRAAQPTRIAA